MSRVSTPRPGGRSRPDRRKKPVARPLAATGPGRPSLRDVIPLSLRKVRRTQR